MWVKYNSCIYFIYLFSVHPDQLVEEQELCKKNLEEINSLKSKLL